MELTHLRYFVNAAKTGSFVKGAQLSNVSPPAMSKAIKKLEDELGTPLFARTSRATVLTESGEILLAHCRTVFRSINNFYRALEESQSKICGELLVGASELFALQLLPSAVSVLTAEHRHVIPKCYSLPPDLIEQALIDGDLDVGFIAGAEPSKTIAQADLGESHGVVVCGCDHELFDVGAITREQLATLPFVAAHGDSHPSPEDRHVGAATDSLALGIEMVARGELLGFFPEVAVRRHVEAGALRILESPVAGNSVVLYALELKGATAKPATPLLISAVRDAVSVSFIGE